MMNRVEFLAAAAAFAVRPRQESDTLDPASESQSQSLRVLLGSGSAQRVDQTSFVFEGRRYRGSYTVTADGQIVNTVPLEQYLYGVVAREMPPSWPKAALQVQAIVARTYVLQRSNPNRAYDLVPSEADQVYTGMDGEHAESSAAVDATTGTVLRYGDGFAQVLYSSCCGGHTESNADAWGGRALPYLAGVRCGYCTQSPWYAWSKSLALEWLQRALEPRLGALDGVESIALDDADASGRAQSWTFASSGRSVEIKAEDVRRLLGTRVLPSLLVHAVRVQADRSVRIEGGGLGHGVGLCQWGARGMALTGADAPAILAYYYPGTGIGND